jgi:hypothetical protein
MSFTDLFRSRSALPKRREEIGKNQQNYYYSLEFDERDDASDDDDIQTFKSKPRSKKTKTEKKTRAPKKKPAQTEHTDQNAPAPDKDVVEIDDDDRAPEFLTAIEQYAEKNKTGIDAMQKLR